jgi:hypothetical protein
MITDEQRHALAVVMGSIPVDVFSQHPNLYSVLNSLLNDTPVQDDEYMVDPSNPPIPVRFGGGTEIFIVNQGESLESFANRILG